MTMRRRRKKKIQLDRDSVGLPPRHAGIVCPPLGCLMESRRDCKLATAIHVIFPRRLDVRMTQLLCESSSGRQLGSNRINNRSACRSWRNSFTGAIMRMHKAAIQASILASFFPSHSRRLASPFLASPCLLLPTSAIVRLRGRNKKCVAAAAREYASPADVHAFRARCSFVCEAPRRPACFPA